MESNPHTGSSFDDWLREEGIYETCTETALKRVLARMGEQVLRAQDVTKDALAHQRQTSRSQPDKQGITGTSLPEKMASLVLERQERITAETGRLLVAYRHHTHTEGSSIAASERGEDDDGHS